MGSPRHLASLAATPLALTLLLSACGSTSIESVGQPGAAAIVGERSVSIDAVDKLATSYCELYRDQGSGAAVANRALRDEALTLLVNRAVAEQFEAASEIDSRGWRNWLRKAGAADAAQRGLEGQAAQTFIELAYQPDTQGTYLTAGGAEVPSAAGGAQPAAANLDDEALYNGWQAVASWASDLEIEYDPRFALPDAQAEEEPPNNTLAQPVSPLARAATLVGESEQDQADYVAALPASGRCG